MMRKVSNFFNLVFSNAYLVHDWNHIYAARQFFIHLVPNSRRRWKISALYKLIWLGKKIWHWGNVVLKIQLFWTRTILILHAHKQRIDYKSVPIVRKPRRRTPWLKPSLSIHNKDVCSKSLIKSPITCTVRNMHR